MTVSNANEQRPPTWKIAIVAAALLGTAGILLCVSWQANRPTQLPDAADEKLACASYTPSHDGHSLPAEQTRALVKSDLQLLAKRFRCVRTYSVSEGLDDVPKVARQLGLEVLLGLWISSDAASNDAEIAHGIELANRYAGTVTAIIVGNEVLLRREQTPEQLRVLLERVRAGTQVPVSYADVWEFWLRNPSLAEVVNFVTIHILPYWEDQPIGIDHALDHVRNIYTKVQTAYRDKRIFIGETGWPSVGRPRMEATPSLINAARFTREFVAYAEKNEIPYNLIEAFDQPWKRIQEGTVGGYWGLYDAQGRPKFALQGPIPADDSLRVSLFAALAAALAFALVGLKFGLRTGARSLALLGVAGYIAGYVLVVQWHYLETANRTWLEWLATVVWSVTGWAAYVMTCLSLARWMNGAALTARPASAATIVASWGNSPIKVAAWSKSLGLLRLLTLIDLAYVSIALAYDGRGRDFPIALIAMPIAGFALLEFATFTEADNDPLANEELLLAATVLLSTLFFAWSETLHNLRAMSWSALCVLFVAILFAGHWRAMRPRERAEQQSGSTQLERV